MPITKEELKTYKKVEKHINKVLELVSEFRDEAAGNDFILYDKTIEVPSMWDDTIVLPIDYLFIPTKEIRVKEKELLKEEEEKNKIDEEEDAVSSYKRAKQNIKNYEEILKKLNIDPNTL